MPPSLIYNYDYLTSESMIAVAVVFPVLAIVAVGLRLYCRRKQHVLLGIDDWLILPAMILTIGMGVSVIIGVRNHGFGYASDATPKDALTFTDEQTQMAEKIEWSIQLQQILQLGFVKMSIIMFYKKIFYAGQRNWFSTVTTVISILIGLWTIGFFFGYLFACGKNFFAVWGSQLDYLTYCINTLNENLAFAISDMIMDFILITMPIPQIWSLHIERKRKFAVMGVFLLAALAFVASIIRMSIYIIILTAGFDPHEDSLLVISMAIWWSMIESGLAVVAACLPTLKFLFGRWSIEALVSSIRSAFSLHSLRTRASRERYERTSYEDAPSLALQPTGKAPDATPSLHSHVMTDNDSTTQLPVPSGRSMVATNAKNSDGLV